MPIAAERGSQFSQRELENITRLKKKWQPDGSHDTYALQDDVIDHSYQPTIFADTRVHDEISKDLSRLEMLQYQFDQALGKKGPDNGIIRSYNPVLARWKYEQCRTPEEKEDFRAYETLQIRTMLREMCRVESSTIQYAIDNEGKLRNEHLPDEPFENVLVRGVEYRKQHSTPEPERERSEVLGFLKVQEKLVDPMTPLGTRMVVISPPGIAPESAYTDNFIDHFIKDRDAKTGEVKVTLERIISPLDYQQTVARVKEIQPGFFDNYRGPLDAFFLEHPFEYYGEVTDREGMKAELNRRLEAGWLPFIDHLREWIMAETYSPVEIAKAYNTLISIATDDIKQVVEDPQETTGKVIYRNVEVEVAKRGSSATKQQVAGCGAIESFDLQSDPSSNSVSKFGEISEAEKDPNLCRCGGQKPHFHCPGEITTREGKKEPCKKAIIVGKGIKQCPDCGAGKVC